MKKAPNTVLERIEKAKEMTGITSRSIARAVDQTEQDFRYHAKKSSGHRYEWLKGVAKALGCRLEWLAEGTGAFAEVPETTRTRDEALWKGMIAQLPQTFGWRLGYGCARPAVERALDAYARLFDGDGTEQAKYEERGADVGRALLAPLRAMHVNTELAHPLITDAYAAALAAHLFAFVREMRINRECTKLALRADGEPSRAVELRASSIPALHASLVTEIDACDAHNRHGYPGTPDFESVLEWAEIENGAPEPKPPEPEPEPKRKRGRPRKAKPNADRSSNQPHAQEREK